MFIFDEYNISNILRYPITVDRCIDNDWKSLVSYLCWVSLAGLSMNIVHMFAADKNADKAGS